MGRVQHLGGAPWLAASVGLLLFAATGCSRIGFGRPQDAAPFPGPEDAGGASESQDLSALALSFVIAANSDDPTQPLSPIDRRVLPGAPIYIKWQASGRSTLAAPITLEASTDGEVFSLLSRGLPNAAGSGCTVAAPHSGCYRWASAPSGYVKFRLTFRDGSGHSVEALSAPLNASAPALTAVSAAVVDQPDNPPSDAQLTTRQGSAVYIKWRATDDLALPAVPLRLYYTVDDATFLPIALAVSNQAGADCVLSGDETGCYVWRTPPASGYFRVRVLVQNVDGALSAASTSPFNAGPPLRLLAGSPDLGTGISAASGVFLSHRDLTQADAATLAVSSGGTIYFRDATRGLLVVDPVDGVMRVLLARGAESSGDGGPAAKATLRAVPRIALDHQGRLLFFDHDRIRRIDTTLPVPSVETVIGGGTSTADGVRPTEVLLEAGEEQKKSGWTLLALPNGDIYFRAAAPSGTATSPRLRVLRQASGRVESIAFSGLGDGLSPTQEIRDCAVTHVGVVYDPQSSALRDLVISTMREPLRARCTGEYDAAWARLAPATGIATSPPPPFPTSASWRWGGHDVPIQGMDGQLYLLSRVTATVFRLDPVANRWVPVLGTGHVGTCADGTAALSCALDVQDAFVDARGRMTFVDRGQIRAVDAAGKVVTLLGQSLHFGDGGDARWARFGAVPSLAYWRDASSERVIVADPAALRVREFRIGGTVTTLAGNGSNEPIVYGTPATKQGLFLDFDRGTSRIVVEPQSGDVFAATQDGVARLVRSAGSWTRLVGGGNRVYFDAGADGRPGAELDFTEAFMPVPLGLGGAGLLTCHHHWADRCGGANDTLLKYHDTTDGTQSQALGAKGCSPTDREVCLDGTQADACGLRRCSALLPAIYDASAGRWLFAVGWENAIRIFSPGATVQTLTLVDRAILAFAYERDATLARNTIYYCSDDGRLYARNLNTATESALPWPIASISCVGDSLLFVEQGRRLIFAYQQHGMTGVAEYRVP